MATQPLTHHAILALEKVGQSSYRLTRTQVMDSAPIPYSGCSALAGGVAPGHPTADPPSVS